MKCMKITQKKRVKRTKKTETVEENGDETMQKSFSFTREEIVRGYLVDRSDSTHRSNYVYPSVTYSQYLFRNTTNSNKSNKQ